MAPSWPPPAADDAIGCAGGDQWPERIAASVEPLPHVLAEEARQFSDVLVAPALRHRGRERGKHAGGQRHAGASGVLVHQLAGVGPVSHEHQARRGIVPLDGFALDDRFVAVGRAQADFVAFLQAQPGHVLGVHFHGGGFVLVIGLQFAGVEGGALSAGADGYQKQVGHG